MIEYVKEFNEKFGLPIGDRDALMKDPQVQNYRTGFLQEELNELVLAFAQGNKVDAFDALLDLVYVAQGTALFMGISGMQWDAGMRAVHAANMAKERAGKASDSKRGATLDVVKPAGWAGPEARLAEILLWGGGRND